MYIYMYVYIQYITTYQYILTLHTQLGECRALKASVSECSRYIVIRRVCTV